MDVFLWGVLKDMVYKEKSRTVPDICPVIADKIATIGMELCQKICCSVALLLHNWFPALNTTGNDSNCLNDLFEHCCNLTSFFLIIVSSLFYS